MARDNFFADVRRAVSIVAPRVETNSPFTNNDYLQKMLRAADLWLTPTVVAAFEPGDFADVDGGVRDMLANSVEEFRRIATAVDPNGPVRPEQREAALPSFTQVVKIVQEFVREDWVSASAALLAEAEVWAKEQGWPTKRFSRDLTEDFIGQYRLKRLLYSTEGAQLALIPVGRFAPGTDGMFDLAVMPAYDSMMVVRQQGQWFVYPLPGQEGQQDWSKETFVSKSHDLARLP